MIYELVYASRANHFAFTPDGLYDLLKQSRKRNQLLGITGLLLYEKGEFIQLLEGPQDAVRFLYYDCIYRDPRHRRQFVCWEGRKKERSFVNWQMGFASGKALARIDTDGASGFLRRGVAELDLSTPRSTGRDLLLALYASLERS